MSEIVPKKPKLIKPTDQIKGVRRVSFTMQARIKDIKAAHNKTKKRHSIATWTTGTAAREWSQLEVFNLHDIFFKI